MGTPCGEIRGERQHLRDCAAAERQHLRMSAIGGIAVVRELPYGCLLIAKLGHWALLIAIAFSHLHTGGGKRPLHLTCLYPRAGARDR